MSIKIRLPDFDQFPIRFAAIATPEKSLSSHHLRFLKRRMFLYLDNREFKEFKDLYIYFGVAYSESEDLANSPWIADIGVDVKAWPERALLCMGAIYPNWSGTIRAGVAFTIRPLSYAKLLEKPLFWHEADSYTLLAGNDSSSTSSENFYHAQTWADLIAGKIGETQLLSLIKDSGGVEYVKLPFTKIWDFVESGKYDPPFLELYLNQNYNLRERDCYQNRVIEILVAYSEAALYYEEMWQIYKRLKICTKCSAVQPNNVKTNRACTRNENEDCFKKCQNERKRRSAQKNSQI